MNNLNKDILILIGTFLKNKYNLKELYFSNNNSLRQCSKYISIVIGQLYFSDLNVNINIINNDNKYLFRSFIHKYNILISASNVYNLYQLAFLNTINIKKIYFNNMDNAIYYEYLIPKTKEIHNLNSLFDYELLPPDLKVLSMNYEFDSVFIVCFKIPN